MSHHRSGALSHCLSTLTQAQLPPHISNSGKPHLPGRLGMFLCVLATMLMVTGLIAGLTAHADSINPVAVVAVDAASYQTTLAPNSIASAFGTQLATQTAIGGDTDPVTAGVQLPTTLGGTTLEVNGVAAGLLFVSAGQINFIMPADVGSGTATIVVRSGDDVVSQGTISVAIAAPTLFTTSQSGGGAPAAVVTGDGIQYDLVGNSDGSTRPVQAGYVLVLFGTGVRGAANGSVHVLIGGIDSQVLYANLQPDFVGLDQINVTIPASLQGRGVVDLVVTIGSVTSNTVNIEIAGASAGPTPPTVSGFNVQSALAGQTITIQGSNFSTTAGQNTVRIGSIEAQVTQASATQLTVVVPFGVATGQVKVTTSNGDGQSASQLPIRTSISGTIQSTGGSALQGATVRLSGTSKVAVSNDQGLFLLSDVTAGAAVVEVDGTTVPSNPPYPSITLKMVVSGNRDNQVPQPVSMQQTNGASVSVGGSSGTGIAGKPSSRKLSGKGKKLAATTVATNGVTLSIPGTVNFTDGTTSGTITLTVVDRQRLPVSLPARIFSSTIVQITPFDATFSPSADITFPNSDNIAAGTVVDLYAYDNSITPSGFTKRGTAQVSDDGQTIVGTSVIDRASIWFAAISQIQTTTVKGTIVGANGNAVRNARAVLRGRSAISDGNGAFAISDVPVKNGEQLTIDVEYLSPFGRTLKVSKTVTAVPDGVTDAGQIQLPAEPSLVLALSPRSLNLVAGDSATLQVASTLPAPPGGLTLNLSKDIAGLTLGSPTVTIPAGEITATFTVTAVSAGKATVSVATTNNAAKDSATILITRPAPVLAGLTPNSGPPSTQIGINGTGFSLKPRQNLVAFEQNGQIILASPDTTKVLGTTTTPFLMATVPPLAVGGAQVYVVSLDDNGVPSATSNKLTFAVTGAPQIQSISPNPAEVGTEVTITGSGFSSAPFENAVLFSVPYITIPGSTQPVFAQGQITSATTTELRVRVPGYASSGPVFVVRNPARKFGQDAGLVRLDKMGGSTSMIFLGFNVTRATNFLAQKPILTYGNAFPNTANIAATSTRLIAANPSSQSLMLYDISGSHASAPLPMTPLEFPQLPAEIAVDGNLAIVGFYPFFDGRQPQSPGQAPAAQIVNLATGSVAGSIMLSPSVQPSEVKVALSSTTALLATNGSLYVYNVSGANPSPLGNLPLGGFVNALTVHGTLALASLDDRLLVIDLTTPAQPVIKATITDFSAIDSGTLPFDIQSDLHITSVALKGTTGIALVNGVVVTLDLSVPSAPRVLGSAGLTFDDSASFAINGSTLIVGNQIAGVMLVDISDPTRPFTVSVFDTPGGDPGVVGVASVGNYIYTNETLSFFTDDPNANNGLISTIQLAGTQSTPIPYFDVFPVTPIAPGDIVTIRGYNLGDKPGDVSVMFGGVTAPVLRANPTSYIPSTNITELTVQVPAAARPTAQGLHVDLQVGGAAAGVDLGFNSQGSAIKRVKALSTGTPGVGAITRLGNSPYVAGASKELGISIVNTSTGELTGFVSVGQLHATPKILQFAYARLGATDYLVVFGVNESTHAPGLTLVNVSNPAKPFVASETAFAVTTGGGQGAGAGAAGSGPQFEFDNHVENLIVSGNMAYIHSDVLNILDLSNPSAPVYKGSYQPMNAVNIPEHASGIALMGTNTIALTTFEGAIHLLNVSNPVNVQLIGKYVAPPPEQTTFALPPASFNGAVTFLNPHVVVAASESDGQLYFVDFVAPANPMLISQLQARASSFVVDAANNLLILSVQEGNPYAGGLTSGDFAVVDIANLTTPQFLGALNTVGSGRSVVMLGPNLYALADGADSIIGLQIISVDPSKFGPAGAASSSIKVIGTDPSKLPPSGDPNKAIRAIRATPSRRR